MIVAPVLLAAALVTCGDLGPPDLRALPGRDVRVMLRLEQTSLDRVLKILGRMGGFRTTFAGFTPRVDVSFEDRRLEDVLSDLAARHGLAYQLASPEVLEVAAPVLPGLDGVTEPRVKEKVPPIFPKEARGAEGRVVLAAVVCEDGRVGALHVLRGPPEIAFREAAVKAVGAWSFEPATRAGKAVPAYTTVTVDFTRPQ